jgi:hypothetical protein
MGCKSTLSTNNNHQLRKSRERQSINSNSNSIIKHEAIIRIVVMDIRLKTIQIRLF